LAVLITVITWFGTAKSPTYFYIIKATSTCFSPESQPVGRQTKTPGTLTTLAVLFAPILFAPNIAAINFLLVDQIINL
jgi:hypothetical protein